VSLFIDVVFLAKNALELINTAIANVRRIVKLVADLLLVVRAELIAQVAGSTFAVAIGFVRTNVNAKMEDVAVFPLDTAVRDAIGGAFIARDCAGADFP